MLPRHARCVLSCLCCNEHSLLLGSYLSRIGRTENPSCSTCGHSSQNTSHLILHCPATDSLHRSLLGNSLSRYDLWSRPWGVARLLGLHGLLPCPIPRKGSGKQHQHQVSVANSTVFRHLDAMTYSLKTGKFEPKRANTPENEEKRKIFVQELLAYQSHNVSLLYIDETNLYILISPSVGRSLSGQRCTVVVLGLKGSNFHMIDCIGFLGLIHHEIKRGSFCREDAMQWIHICSEKRTQS